MAEPCAIRRVGSQIEIDAMEDKENRTSESDDRGLPWGSAITNRRANCPSTRGGRNRTSKIAASFSYPQNPAPPLVLPIPPLAETTLMIVVEEGDNRPLSLAAGRLELPHYRLRFLHPGAEALSLLYGNSSLEAPRYDLALMSPQLVGLPSLEVGLEAETDVADKEEEASRQTVVFWGARVEAVVVLLGLLVRLLRTVWA